jgi:PAS domain S-box-containing protein
MGADGEDMGGGKPMKPQRVSSPAGQPDQAPREEAAPPELGLVSGAPIGLFASDPAGRCLYVNRHWSHLTGRSFADSLGLGWLEAIHPADRARMAEAWREAVAAEAPLRAQLRLLRAAGPAVWVMVEACPNRDARGRLTGYAGALMDITARVMAEGDLRRSNAFFQAQMQATQDGILVVDEHQQIQSYNERFRELWGVPAELAASRDDQRLLAFVSTQLKEPEDTLARIAFLYAHPEESAWDEVALADGRVFERYSAPVTGPDGTYYGRIWHFRDITERKRLEAQLVRQNARLVALDQARSGLLHAVSHDLRTPLTSILGYTEFLDEGLGGALTADQAQFVGQIALATRRLIFMVDDLLDAARQEAGTFRLSLAPADLDGQILEVTQSLRPQLEAAGLRLSLSLTDPPLCARMDAHRITQVLSNLLTNAIKFSPEGQTVSVRACRAGDLVRCEIADRGPGLAEADQAKLFERFAQLEAGKRRGGTGLGLYIARQIVEAHGGAIGVESAPGEGATFWFTLPVAGPPAEGG